MQCSVCSDAHDQVAVRANTYADAIAARAVHGGPSALDAGELLECHGDWSNVRHADATARGHSDATALASLKTHDKLRTTITRVSDVGGRRLIHVPYNE